MPHGTPSCVNEMIAHYLVSGASRSPPNVDVDMETIEIGSNGEARRVIAQAAAEGRTFWAAVHVPRIEHPSWWPARAVKVPGFEHMIVGCGHAGIGMHRDRYTGDDTERLVSTYLALGAGRKHVVLLPPTEEGSRVAEELGGAGCDETYGRKESQRVQLPASPHPDMLRRVLEAGGFWFDMEASSSVAAIPMDGTEGSVRRWADGRAHGEPDESDTTDADAACIGTKPAPARPPLQGLTCRAPVDSENTERHAGEEVDVDGDDDDDDDEEEEVKPICLFLPHGWYHWLAGDAPWHVAWSGSFFPGAPASDKSRRVGHGGQRKEQRARDGSGRGEKHERGGRRKGR